MGSLFKHFTFHGRSTRKEWANSMARGLRRRGYYARIVERPHIKPDKHDGKRYKYAVYKKKR